MTVPPGMPVVIAAAGQFSDPVLAFLDEQVAVFEAANPNIRVELVQLEQETAGALQAQQALVSALQAHDTSLDVLVIEQRGLAELAAAGWLVPLATYTQTLGISPDQLPAATLQATLVDGEWVALPWTANGQAGQVIALSAFSLQKQAALRFMAFLVSVDR